MALCFVATNDALWLPLAFTVILLVKFFTRGGCFSSSCFSPRPLRLALDLVSRVAGGRRLVRHGPSTQKARQFD